MTYYQQRPRRTLLDWYLRTRSTWRRRMRLLFPSPAEVRFIEIMNGRVLNIPFIKSMRTGFCLTFVLSMGELRRERVRREVRIGRYYADLCVMTPYYRKIIEVDGAANHSSRMDIVADQQREDYLRTRGFTIYRIPARRLWREPKRVREDVLKFLGL